MPAPVLYNWQQAPFLRLVIPFIAGIAWGTYCNVALLIQWSLIIVAIAGLLLWKHIALFIKFQRPWVAGVFINLLLIMAGSLLTYYNNKAYNKNFIGKQLTDSSWYIITLQEPLSEKTNSFKTTATVAIVNNNAAIPTSGNIIVYFQKDSSTASLQYGNRLLLRQPLQLIKNAGNPGGFDYSKYCQYQGLYYQFFLKPGQYSLLQGTETNFKATSIYKIRKWVIEVIEENISGTKEAGLAEALLIGYKDDLDKNLVQAYSNTGVVHVIAISGLHLGLIYWLLQLLTIKLKSRKYTQWLQPLIIIFGLWGFSLLAGAGPSVIRSAVMFTCLVVGKLFNKNGSSLNALAAAAFLLLAYNPYWLWDVGFQLSFAAVLSIVIFYQPIYNWLLVQNKLLNFFWQLNALTLAAQVLTIPLSIYHFHQFPNLFLLTNLVAVPLSSAVLLAIIFLCAFSFIPVIASSTGKCISWLIQIMNGFIERMDSLSFARLDFLQINLWQLLFIYAFLAAIAYWLFYKSKPAFIIALCGLLVVTGLRTAFVIKSQQQEKIIVYNVPKQEAIDIIHGDKYLFRGDSSLLADDFLQNFHLKPSRINHRVAATPQLHQYQNLPNGFIFNNTTVVCLNNACFPQQNHTIDAQLVILSKNTPFTLQQVCRQFGDATIVIDASNSYRQLNRWKTEATILGIKYYSVVDNGAFVMPLK
jgi:competence protein ComEC